MAPPPAMPNPGLPRGFIAVVIVVLLLVPLASGLGVPGTMVTNSGYDTEGGTDPVCWLSMGVNTTAGILRSAAEPKVVTKWDNELVADYEFEGGIELMKDCPNGTSVEAFAPLEFVDGFRPRTGEEYNYRVRGHIDVDQLLGDTVVADGEPRVAIQIVLCQIARGFCSPFVHEQASARLKAAGITEKLERGDLHGGTHVHSGYQFIRLESTCTVNPKLCISKPGIHRFELTVPMKINEAGSFFAIAALQLFTANADAPRKNEGRFVSTDQPSSLEAQYKYDVAGALDPRIITYQDPAEIKEVSQAVEITTWALIGAAGLLIGFLLFETIRHRDHQVIQLSQGYFLILYLFAALVATVSVFLINPKNDIYCNLHSPMIFISLQFMYAIMIGRLWRINAVISPLLMMTLKKQKSMSQSFFDTLGKITAFGCTASSTVTGRRKSIRQTVSWRQLALVVGLFTFPQVVIQVVSLVMYPNKMEIDYNEDESVGRTVCESEDDRKLEGVGIFLLIGLFVVLLVLAHQSRRLPSLFNETNSIYSATLTSLLLLVLGLVLLAVTDEPTTSPDVQYILFAVITLSVTINSSVRIMLPKLQMVWRGETVVVSKLVSDHRKSRERQSVNSSIQTKTESNRWVLAIGTGNNTKEDTQLNNPKPPSNVSSGEGPSSVELNSETKLSSGADSDGALAGEGLDEFLDTVDVPMKRKSSVSTLTRFQSLRSMMTRESSNRAVGGIEMTPKAKKSVHFAGASGNCITEEASDSSREGDAPDEELAPTSAHSWSGEGSAPLVPGAAEGKGKRGRRHSELSSSKEDDAVPGSSSLRTPRKWKVNKNFSVTQLMAPGAENVPPAGLIRIGDDAAPPRRLVLRLVDLQEMLREVNDRIMTGLLVSHQEWETLRELSTELGQVFDQEVSFQWEQNEVLT